MVSPKFGDLSTPVKRKQACRLVSECVSNFISNPSTPRNILYSWGMVGGEGGVFQVSIFEFEMVVVMLGD